MGEFLGYFDDPTQQEPTFDPGVDISCPVCLRKLYDPMKTISLMKIGSNKSYFFRIHKHCSGPEADKIEWSIVDGRDDYNGDDCA